MVLNRDVEKQDAIAIIRLLNGPMSGCEYKIVHATTIVIVDSSNAFSDRSIIPDFPINSIVLPLIEGALNFEIMIDENHDDSFRLHVSDTNEDRFCFYQKIIHVGGLRFSLRRPNDEWAFDIDVLDHPVKSAHVFFNKFWRRVFVGVIVMFLLFCTALKFWIFNQEDKRIAEITDVISGSNHPYQIISTNDGAIYIFAENERDVSWAKQALIREGFFSLVRISTITTEEERVNKLLFDKYPFLAYHRIKLTNPQKPILILSKERGEVSEQLQKSLVGDLHRWLPYSQAIELDSWADSHLKHRAKTGLDLLGIAYSETNNGINSTYSIHGSLSDTDLLNLQEFSENFYHNFGTRYVHFSIELKDDLMKDRSFQYGNNSYIKMNSRHWFFREIS